MTPIVIIDVSSYIFRAYYALPPFTAPDGRQVNAIHGFISSFLKLTKHFKQFEIIAALDSGRETFRRERYEAYKANRKEIDPSLREQFPLIEPMLRALNIPIAGVPGYEADDIIAALCSRYDDRHIAIVSTDKDLMQLVNDTVILYDTFKNREIGPPEVEEKLGVPPHQVKEFLALMGDASDNIPGLPGIGKKSAAKLLKAYGSIDGIYKHLDELPPRQKKVFSEQKELLDLSLFLVSFKFPDSIEAIPHPWNSVDPEEFYRFAAPLGLKRFISQLVPEEIRTSLTKQPTPKKSEPFRYKTDMNLHSPLLALMHTNDNWFVGKDGVYTTVNPADIPADTELWGFDIKSALRAPFPSHLNLKDLQIAHFIASSGLHKYTMAELYFNATGEKPASNEPGTQLAVLHDIYTQLSLNDKQKKLLNDIEMPHAEVIRIMEQEGIAVDTDKLLILLNSYSNHLQKLESEIYDAAGETFNINSPQQLAVILFEKCGYPVIRKSKNGPSTDKHTLDELSRRIPENEHCARLPELIGKYREYAKLIHTYLEPIRQKTGNDGRLRTTFLLTHAATGRLSSRNPNLQNIPAKTDIGKEIRSLFTARDGYTLVSLDYSQIELRVLAALSGEKELIEAFRNGEDIHVKTAAAIFGTFPEFVDSTMRSHAKAVNFGIIYGMQAFKLSQDTGVSLSFAKQYIDNYFTFYKGTKQFIDRTIKKAEERGYVETVLGRRRYIPELKQTNKTKKKHGERMAINTVIQGSAADIIKKGTVALYRHLQTHAPHTKILLQIHDELILETPIDKVSTVIEDSVHILENAAPFFDVPLTVHHSSGFRWNELK